jgi:hypothetical protein
MSQVYNYTISTDFPNQKVDAESLASQIAAALPLPAPQLDEAAGGIGVRVTGPDNCDIWFDAALDAAQQLTLDGVVAAHSGYGTVASCFATAFIANLGTPIVGAGWQVLAGLVTTPSWYAPVDQIVGKVLGQVKTDGLGATLKIVQTTTGGVITDLSPATALPDTGGAWQAFTVNSDTPPGPETWNTYTVQVDKGAVANVEFRYASFSMLHVMVI